MTAVCGVLAVVDVDGVVVVEVAKVVVGVEEVADNASGVDEDVELPSTEPTDADSPSSQIVHVLLPPPGFASQQVLIYKRSKM